MDDELATLQRSLDSWVNDNGLSRVRLIKIEEWRSSFICLTAAEMTVKLNAFQRDVFGCLQRGDVEGAAALCAQMTLMRICQLNGEAPRLDSEEQAVAQSEELDRLRLEVRDPGGEEHSSRGTEQVDADGRGTASRNGSPFWGWVGAVLELLAALEQVLLRS